MDRFVIPPPPPPFKPSGVVNKGIFFGSFVFVLLAPVLNENTVKSEILVRVTMQLDCLKLTLNRNGKAFAVGTISQSSAQIQYWEDDTMEIKLLFGNFVIEDPVTETRGPKDIFRVKGDHLVEVYYRSFLESDADFTGYHSWLRVRLNSIRYIFVQSFLTEILRWFSDYSKLKATYLAAEQNYRNKVSE